MNYLLLARAFVYNLRSGKRFEARRFFAVLRGGRIWNVHYVWTVRGKMLLVLLLLLVHLPTFFYLLLEYAFQHTYIALSLLSYIASFMLHLLFYLIKLAFFLKIALFSLDNFFFNSFEHLLQFYYLRIFTVFLLTNGI